jgi:hypothetical protein
MVPKHFTSPTAPPSCRSRGSDYPFLGFRDQTPVASHFDPLSRKLMAIQKRDFPVIGRNL